MYIFRKQLETNLQLSVKLIGLQCNVADVITYLFEVKLILESFYNKTRADTIEKTKTL